MNSKKLLGKGLWIVGLLLLAFSTLGDYVLAGFSTNAYRFGYLQFIGVITGTVVLVAGLNLGEVKVSLGFRDLIEKLRHLNSERFQEYLEWKRRQ